MRQLAKAMEVMKSMTALMGVVGIAVLSLLGFFYLAGARINTSNSIPLGVYWFAKRPIQKGEYVLFCPPLTPLFQEALARGYIHAGFCPGGFGTMMKQVVAMPGDMVSINPAGALGVWVNHKYIAHSRPYLKDEQNRALPQLHLRQYQLQEAQLLLMSDQNELSFDGRYFGLIQQAQVQSVIQPVLTWNMNNSIT